MHRFFIKIPLLVRWLFPRYLWRMPTREKVLYLTFDDGPHPTITPFVLDTLKQYGARATFFCIGKNVVTSPEVYQRILAEGHAVGNHTHNHPSGLSTPTDVYLSNIREAALHIDSHLFRPPYGRITRKQAAGVGKALEKENSRIVMWDVLSADFDRSVTPERCLRYVVRHARPGSIVVFHDSVKAFNNMRFALPRVLEHFAARGYVFTPIEV